MGLKEPSFVTAAVISLVRVCGLSVKVKDGTVANGLIKMTGHAISFLHGAVGICDESILGPLQVEQSLHTGANCSNHQADSL